MRVVVVHSAATSEVRDEAEFHIASLRDLHVERPGPDGPMVVSQVT
jgi:hypothetical protein